MGFITTYKLKIGNDRISDSWVVYLQLILVFGFCALPLFITYPFRQDIYLTWEGAYRISIGQIPFKDFGMPLGIGFWIMPGLFFKIFGPQFYSLLITQFVINVLFLLAVRKILMLFRVTETVIFFAILVFCFSFVIKNFWPWYNHTVVFYELWGLYFLLKFIFKEVTSNWRIHHGLINLSLASFFNVLAIFTKQDIGLIGFLLGLILLLVDMILYMKNAIPFIVYVIISGVFIALHIVPFLQFNFGYWFNYGQPPHYSRLNIVDFMIDIFGGSHWIKFYTILIFILVLYKWGVEKYNILDNKKLVFFTLFTLLIIFQSAIIQTTSYQPATAYFFFHGFAIALFLQSVFAMVDFRKWFIFILMCFLLLFWWSEYSWEYGSSMMSKWIEKHKPPAGVISKHTRLANSDSTSNYRAHMVKSSLPSLYHIKITEESEIGLRNLISSYQERFSEQEDVSVLNMSELTFLAKELEYVPLHGTSQPLWYHVDVCFFPKEMNEFANRISNAEFDVVIFQRVAYSKNYFPNELDEILRQSDQYMLLESFPAPKGFPGNTIFVYFNKK